MQGGYHTYKGTFRMQNSCTLLLLLCQFGNQTVGMEGIRNDLPLSFSYVSVAEGGTQYSVQPSSDPGRSEYAREKKGSEGKEMGKVGFQEADCQQSLEIFYKITCANRLSFYFGSNLHKQKLVLGYFLVFCWWWYYKHADIKLSVFVHRRKKIILENVLFPL